jgi:hypothetical protein
MVLRLSSVLATRGFRAKSAVEEWFCKLVPVLSRRANAQMARTKPGTHCRVQRQAPGRVPGRASEDVATVRRLRPAPQPAAPSSGLQRALPEQAQVRATAAGGRSQPEELDESLRAERAARLRGVFAFAPSGNHSACRPARRRSRPPREVWNIPPRLREKTVLAPKRVTRTTRILGSISDQRPDRRHRPG